MIHKYQIQYVQDNHIIMPLGAKILDVQMQGNTLYLWAIVDTEQPPAKRHILMMGTGWIYDNIGPHIATIQDGVFVWHFFDQGYI